MSKSANFSPRRLFCSSSGFSFSLVCRELDDSPIQPSSSLSQWILVSTPGGGLWGLLGPVVAAKTAAPLYVLLRLLALVVAALEPCRRWVTFWGLREREYGAWRVEVDAIGGELCNSDCRSFQKLRERKKQSFVYHWPLPQALKFSVA